MKEIVFENFMLLHLILTNSLTFRRVLASNPIDKSFRYKKGYNDQDEMQKTRQIDLTIKVMVVISILEV